MKAFADTFLKVRNWFLVAAVLVSMAAAVGVTRIGFEGDPGKLFRTEDEQYRYLDEVFQQFGTDDDSFYIIATARDLFSPDSMADLRRLSIDINKISGIQSVHSITQRRLVAADAALRPLAQATKATLSQLSRARRRALEHPVFAGQFLSEDGNSALIKAELVQGLRSISQMEPVTESLWALTDRVSKETSLQVMMTGIPAIRVEGFNSVRAKSAIYTVLGAIAGLVMAVLLMRRVATVLLVCVASGAGAFWTVGTLGIIGEQITVLTSVLPMLVLIIGLTDSVHLAFDIRQARGAGVSRTEATRGALRHLTMACLLTSVTTVVGFGSLCVTRIELIQRFGFSCALGCAITFISVIVVLPLLSSSRLGDFVLPPRTVGNADRWIHNVLQHGVRLALRYRWMITVSALLLTVGLVIVAMRLIPENEMSESLARNARSNVALREVDASFGGILPSFITVDWPEETNINSSKFREVLQRVHELCETNEVTNHPFSVFNLMQLRKDGRFVRLPDDIVQSLIRPELRRAVVVTRTQDLGSSRLTAAFSELQQELQKLEDDSEGYQFRLTGSAVYATETVQVMISDLASSLGLATAIIFLTMSLACRSIRLGLICLLPNAIPLLITAAFLVCLDGKLRFSSVIVFSVCLGIAVDDTIHVVMRYLREIRECGNVEQAIQRSVSAVGSALVVTTAILIVGLAIPMTSDVPANRMFGALSCVAVFSALVADLVVLPAMLACFARRPEIATTEDTGAEQTSQDV